MPTKYIGMPAIIAATPAPMAAPTAPAEPTPHFTAAIEIALAIPLSASAVEIQAVIFYNLMVL